MKDASGSIVEGENLSLKEEARVKGPRMVEGSGAHVCFVTPGRC